MHGFRCFGCHQHFPSARALDSHQFRPGYDRCRLYWMPRRLPDPLAPDLGGSRMWRFMLDWQSRKSLRKRGPTPPLNRHAEYGEVERWIIWNELKCSRARALVATVLVNSLKPLTMLDMRKLISEQHGVQLSRITIYVAIKEFANAGVIVQDGVFHRPDTAKRGPKPKALRPAATDSRIRPSTRIGLGLVGALPRNLGR